MTSQPLDVTIFRSGRKYDEIQVTADPASPAELREVLEAWLSGNKWGEILWGQFELVARVAGRSKVEARVRVT